MGEIVGVFCASHSPGITGFPERADAAARTVVHDAYAEVAEAVRELEPDAVVAVSVEHFTNFFLGNLPAFAIGTAGSYHGPVTAEMAQFLQVPEREYPGRADLAEHIHRYALRSHFDPSMVAGDFAFDENFCVPLSLIVPDTDIPLVPVIVNGVNPPYPTLARCYDFGRMLREAVAAQTAARRVVVLGTGGLSHWVGMPESGDINIPFDRDFLARLESGSAERLTGYTDEDIDLAGNGAHEIRTWVVAAGAAGAPFTTLAYEAVPAWLTGTAVAAARLPATTERRR
jgi:aromatic ring-opening dioxygenase catalytic subunit (LigB family)